MVLKMLQMQAMMVAIMMMMMPAMIILMIPINNHVDDGGNEDFDRMLLSSSCRVLAYILFYCTAKKDGDLSSSATAERSHRHRGIPRRPILNPSATNPCATA